MGRIALDGSKVKANASRHKAMSYDYMLKEERRLRQEIKALFAQAEGADQAEDQTYGRARRGEELPEELARRQSRLHKIREAKAALEEEAREQARAVEAERQQSGKPPSGHDPECGSQVRSPGWWGPSRARAGTILIHEPIEAVPPSNLKEPLRC